MIKLRIRDRLAGLALALVFVTTHCTYGQLFVNATADFQKANPDARMYEKNGAVTMLYGAPMATGKTPLESATAFVNQWQAMFGKDVGTLAPEAREDGTILQGVMYQPDKGTYKFHVVRFQQLYAGLPVFRSGAGFLIRNEPDHPIVLTGFDIKDLDGFDALGGVAQAKVTDAMLKNVGAMMDAAGGGADEEAVSVLEQPAEKTFDPINPLRRLAANVQQPVEIQTSDEQLVIWAGINNIPEPPRVALSFIATRGSVRTYPDYDRYLVVADVETGEILLAENQIHNVDVNGSVMGRATQGLASAQCDPESAVGLPYAEVQISGGPQVYADANGDFTIPWGGSAPVTVVSRLSGQWFEVRDQAASNTIPELSMSVTPPGPADFLHNPVPDDEFPTANVNAYLESNVVRDFVLSYEPAFPVIATQEGFDVNTNINSTCNAYYDGSSINFFRVGGGCHNTAFSDVVYHEYGHHLINVTGNGQGQMGEGTGDVVGVLIQDDPILGQGFLGNCSQGIRTAINNHQYPCTGAIHDCGQLLSGCVWDTRNELMVTEPSAYLDISSQLFFGMLIVRGTTSPGNSTIEPDITVIYLELDDDDSNIGNGTPHYFEIATGFGAHNMDAPPLELLEFQYPEGRPELISPLGGAAFTVQIVEQGGTYVDGSAMLHVDRGSGFEAFPLNPIGTDLFEVVFPASECGTPLRYYLSADTVEGYTITDPMDAPNSTFLALSGDSIVEVFADDFETHKGWAVSSDATDGDWERGTPVGGGDRGDPPTDADGSGQCYLTDNVDGNSDVDGGTTMLFSPVLDLTSESGVMLVSYYRWYNNVAGNAPEEDVFVVEASNDGGATWVELETVGPSGPEVRGGWILKQIRVSDHLALSSTMRFRFSASDLGSGSVVEAGLDSFKILAVKCTHQVAPDTLNVTSGEVLGGSIDDVAENDNVKLRLQSPRRLGLDLSFEMSGVSPASNPSAISLTFDGSVARNKDPIYQIIEVYNYASGNWEEVNNELAPMSTDGTTTVDLAGNLADYVEPGTNRVKARMTFDRVFRFAALRVKGRIDQFIWTISD